MTSINSTFHLRPATAADSPNIRQFIRNERLNPLGLDWQRFTVAVSTTGQIIGCVQYKNHGEEVIELASLVVDPGWRNQGVGGTLVRHLQEKHGPPLWLMCAGRTAVYYLTFGFEIVTRPVDMPPYFRRMSWLFRLVARFISPDDRLTIMVWR